MYKNRIRGILEEGERAIHRKALVVKAKGCRFDGRAEKVGTLTRGDLTLLLKGKTSEEAE